jgi:hypothetical protein
MKVVLNRNTFAKVNLLVANTWKCPRCGERTSDSWCDECDIHYSYTLPIQAFHGPWTCDYCETVNEASWLQCLVCDHDKPRAAFWA